MTLPLSFEQLELDLFPSPSFLDLLNEYSPGVLTLETSNRLKRSWYVSLNTKHGVRHLVVPAWMESAPKEIKKALIEWALLTNSSRSRNKQNPAKKVLEKTIQTYMTASGRAVKNKSRKVPPHYETHGKVYDLLEVFSLLNTQYFNGSLASHLRWGQHMLRSFQVNKTDNNGNRYSLITIARMYNKPNIPRFAIESIMYHEMLHVAIPPVKVGNRNSIHGPLFKKTEQSFPHYKQWREWEKHFVRSLW
jgi:hypothetical protein